MTLSLIFKVAFEAWTWKCRWLYCGCISLLLNFNAFAFRGTDHRFDRLFIMINVQWKWMRGGAIIWIQCLSWPRRKGTFWLTWENNKNLLYIGIYFCGDSTEKSRSWKVYQGVEKITKSKTRILKGACGQMTKRVAVMSTLSQSSSQN